MPDTKKVLLVGWDAADWKVIDPLMAAGRMPATRSLVERGVRGNLATLFPALSPMLWTSIATGKRPHKHGIYGFSEPTPDGRAVQPMTNTSRRAKAIWNILNQQGQQSIVVGWWPSHPAEPINGVMVSDYYNKAPRRPGQRWELMPSAVHPARCFEELRELRIHPEELEPEHILPFVPDARDVDQETDGRLAGVIRVLCECTMIHAAATDLMETEPWDFAAIYYDAIDHFSHGFMKYHPPQQSNVSDEDFRLFQHVVNSGYIYHDMMLARLLELAGDDTTVLLISDHGFHSDELRPSLLPAEPAGPASEHRDFGIFVAAGPGIRSGVTITGAGLLDVTPTIIPVFGLPVGEDMDGRPLVEIFETPPDIATVPSWDGIAGDDGQHPPGFQMEPSESREALEQLIALGYIERPPDDPTQAIAECKRELDYNLARAYMDAGMHGEAIPLLVLLYGTYPLEFRFGIQLTNCLKAMGRLDDMSRVIDDLNARWRVAKKEARKRLREIVGIARERRDQWRELKKIDDEHKGDASRSRLARMTRTGKPLLFADAETHLIRKLRAVARGNTQTLDFLAASVAASKGDYSEALRRFEATRLTESKAPGFRFQVGSVYHELGRFKEAEEAFLAAIEFDPHFPNGMLGLARTYSAMGRHAEALEHADRAIGLKHHFPAAHYFRGVALEGLGDREGAIASYEKALEQNPNFPEAHEGIASALTYFSASHPDMDRANEHRAAAQSLREQATDVVKVATPLELPPPDAEAIRAGLPAIHAAGTANSETFLRCLAQPPAPSDNGTPNGSGATVTIVSGLPRSGTSMMMQMLERGGLAPHTDGERSADESNPKGYFEAEKVKLLPHDNQWLRDCGGEAVKVVAQLVPYLPQHVDYRVIFMDRALDEVLVSQRHMLERLQRSGATLESDQLAEVFKRQAHFALGVLQLHGVPVLVVSHGEVIRDPQGAAARVAEFVGTDLDTAAMAAAVDPGLYRQRGAKES